MISLKRWPKVEALREKLNGKAKAEPEYRFRSLYDKVYRTDFLEAAYAQCQSNAGAPGVDQRTFADIEAYGVQRFLGELAEELKEQRYAPAPVRRVMIPKANQPGKFRPLGIPTIQDRVVQQAVKLLLEPIFEADFTDNAYGYRTGRSAQQAVRAIDQEIIKRPDVVDADLSKYFDTIPHEQLMCSVERRVGDRRVLWLIRQWLKVPVQELNARGKVIVTGGKKTKCGTPQGGVISPLLANIYFRRFLVWWQRAGQERTLNARIVNYADDFVILTRGQGAARAALQVAGTVLEKIGLHLNPEKTRIVNVWETSFNFLGYRFSKLYGRNGKPYLGERPARKNLEKYEAEVYALTTRKHTCRTPEAVATDLNQLTRGFWNYYQQGTLTQISRALDEYVFQRMVQWARRKYRPSRRTRKNAESRRQRRQKICAATALLCRGREWVQKRGQGPLFNAVQSYAQ